MRIGYTSPFVPVEWIAAHGARPERVVPGPDPGAAVVRRAHGGRVLSLSKGAAEAPLAGVCPYARAFVGEVASGAGYDAVVVTTTCDQMRRASEWMARHSRVPVFLMNVPATWRTPASTALYVAELHRLARFVVELGGRKPSDGELGDVMARYDARRAEIEKLSPREALDATAALDCGEEFRSSGLPAEPDDGGPPVALLGGPLMRGDSWLFDIVEQAGGRVVLDATEGGTRTFPAPFDRRRMRRDPLAELARAYFGSIPDAFRRPDGRLYDWIKDELAASGARGVIVRRYVWCDMWATAHARLGEESPLPVLDLHATGEATPSEGEARRIRAFTEILA